MTDQHPRELPPRAFPYNRNKTNLSFLNWSPIEFNQCVLSPSELNLLLTQKTM